MLVAVGLGFLGFLIGLGVGSEDARKSIQKAFEKEGYDYSKFNDVLHRIDK